MRRLKNGIIIAVMATLTGGLLQAGPAGMPIFSVAMAAESSCSDAYCGDAGGMAMLDCVDHCLAMGDVSPDSGIMNIAAVAAAGLLAVAFFGETRRVPLLAANTHDPSIGGTLALERIATDVMRN